MIQMNWGTLLAALVTPMDERGKVDYVTAADLAEDVLSRGCDGVVVCGTTGEAATLNWAEKRDLLASVGDRIKGKGLLLAGVGSNCTGDTVALIKKTEALPADGYLVITPYYNKPNQAGLVRHFQAVAAATDKPIMLYNVPARTARDMSLADYRLVLAACPSITAVKEASGDLVKASCLTANFPQVSFYSGNDELWLPLMALGFKGVVSVAANVAPGAMAKLADAVRAGEWGKALALHHYLSPLFAALFLETNPVPVKAALAIQGWPVGEPRLPLARLSPNNWNQLLAVMKEYAREGL